MAEGGCLACAESGSAAATPTGFSQMSGLSCPLPSQRRARGGSLQPVMLRMVDDLLVLTPSRAAAEAVILRTMQGAPQPLDCPGGLSASLAPPRALSCITPISSLVCPLWPCREFA